MRFLIRKLLGSRKAEHSSGVVLGFISPDGEVELELDPQMLMPLALEAMNARSTWERKQPASAETAFHALLVERWEIRNSAMKGGVLLSLKTRGGAWLRFEISREAIAAMYQTIQVAEGRQPSPEIPKRKN